MVCLASYRPNQNQPFTQDRVPQSEELGPEKDA